MKKVTVFTGHFGSGKTEVAVNYAIANKVSAICDLDIVNPYFRTNDAKKLLNEKGIKVIAPNFASTNVDIPSLPPDVYSVFASCESAILDVGGDEDGATVLGRYRQLFKDSETEVFMVVNVFRPETSDVEGIALMKDAIENASRLKISGLINNSNLLELTTREHIERGEELVKKACGELSLPFIFTSAMREYAKEGEFPLNKYIKMAQW
ncbi:MAG: hypothetical protein Q8882_05875 [Bacillota bacterium]|nr:hypothetical protein [Bacillota bacterium]